MPCEFINILSLIFGCLSEVVRTVVMKGKAPVDTECKAKLGKVEFLSSSDMKLMIHIGHICDTCLSFAKLCLSYTSSCDKILFMIYNTRVCEYSFKGLILNQSKM